MGDAPSEPGGAPPSSGSEPSDDDKPVTHAELRSLIREEIRDLLPGGDPPADPASGGEPPGEASASRLTMSQIAERSFGMVATALDKIPGPAPAKTEAPKAKPEKAPLGRGMRFLGFGDPE